MEEWDINKVEGTELIKEAINNIFKQNNYENIKFDRFPELLKKEFQKNNIIIKRKSKRRNINNYIKNIYGSIHNLFNEFNFIITIKEGDSNEIIYNKDYNKEAEEFVFI
jgi:hypothetical protein